MGKYNGAVITTAGQNLIAQAIAESKTVTFTTAQASSHVYPSSTDFEALTALTDVESTVNINYAGVYSDTVVQVSARFDNDGVDTAYLINTLGFFAQLGTGTPILFAVSTAVTPDQMPVFDADNPSAFIYNMQITVQNANSINVSVNPAGTVTVEQLNATVSTINASIGDLSDLTTEDKTSLTNAVNEVNTKADNAQTSADVVQAQVSNSDDAYSPSKAYKVDDLCIYNNVLYRCITACNAGSWAINQSCFTQDTLTGVANNLNSALANAPLSLTLGHQATGFYYCSYYKKNKIVHISGDCRGSFNANIDYTVLETGQIPLIRNNLPSGKDDSTRFPITAGNTNGGGYAYVSSTGAIHIITFVQCNSIIINIDFETET